MYTFVGQHLIPQKAIDLSEKIQQIYADLEIRLIPEELRKSDTQPPFAVVNNLSNDVIRYVREDQLDDRLLEWLFEHDSQRHGENVLWDKFHSQMEANVAKREYAQEQAVGERVDLMASVVSSPRHYFKHNGKIIGNGNEAEGFFSKET